MARRKERPKTSDDVIVGEIPTNIDFTNATQSQLLLAYNNFNHRFGLKEAKQVLQKKFTDVDWDQARASDYVTTYAWTIMMEKKGCTLPPYVLKKRDEYHKKLRAAYPIVEKPQVKEAVVEKVFRYPEKKHLATTDEILDSYYDGREKAKPEAVDRFKTLVELSSSAERAEILRLVKALRDEVLLVGKDKDVTEAYSYYKKAYVRQLTAFYKELVDIVEFKVDVHKAEKVRKPRKKKPVPVERKLKYIQYMQSHAGYNLVSIHPERILRANVLFVFNTKTRDLIRYESKEGFDIKGTTILNGTKAVSKKVRKPEAMKEFVSYPRVKTDKEFDRMASKEKSTNYRLNKDTILLKSYQL